MIIDPGHGGSDPGATSSKIYEKDIVLKVALAVGEKASALGRTVRYTRNSDTFVPVDARGDKAGRNEILISIHNNAAVNTAASGVSVWYHGGHTESYALAECIFERLYATGIFKKYGAGVIADTTRYEGGFGVLRHAVGNEARAAVLIELGFISNKLDRAALMDPAKRAVMAKAINDGITAYITKAKERV